MNLQQSGVTVPTCLVLNSLLRGIPTTHGDHPVEQRAHGVVELVRHVGRLPAELGAVGRAVDLNQLGNVTGIVGVATDNEEVEGLYES